MFGNQLKTAALLGLLSGLIVLAKAAKCQNACDRLIRIYILNRPLILSQRLGVIDKKIYVFFAQSAMS
jgi:hypothetical protein